MHSEPQIPTWQSVPLPVGARKRRIRGTDRFVAPMLGITLAVMIALWPALSLVMEAKRESTATRPLTGHSILHYPR
jgi:hypothetical protein